MEDCQSQTTPDELEVAQMVGVDVTCRIDLQCIVVVSRILKQSITGIEDLVRQQEEPFSGLERELYLIRETNTHLETPP